jgi:hypothetical protein
VIVIGCICGGVCEIAIAVSCVTFFGFVIAWIKQLVHKIRCKCWCHKHVCNQEEEDHE